MEKDNRKVKVVANTRPSKHWGGNVYSSDGIAPTLTSGSTIKNGLKIMEKQDKIIEKNFTKVDENRLMTTTKDGNSLAITTTRPTRPIGKKLTNYVLEKKIENNFTKIDDKHYITTDKEKKNCYAITTRQRGRPLHKKQDNYVLEECIGSTQKHAAKTDGTYSPTLTCAMGKGGGHVPMLKLRETTKKGYKEAYPNDGVLVNRGKRKVAKGIVREQESGCLQTPGVWGTVTSDYKIRKLTPMECERLQAFPDDWTKYGKDGEEISDTQRYKCMGNAVTTTVVTAIINRMFSDYDDGKEID